MDETPPPADLPAAVEGPPAWLLESVARTATDAVLITDVRSLDEREGGPCIVYANAAFTRMTGYAPEDVVGRTPRMLQSERTDGAQLRRIRRALARWERVEAELLNVRKDGSEFWIQVSIAPAAESGGPYTHYVSIQRDISERRERELIDEHALRSARERLQSALRNAPIGMAVATPAGTLADVNPALGRLLGRDADGLRGTSLFDVTHPDDREAAYEACTTLSARRGTSRLECRFEHADGRLLDVVVHASLVTDDDDAPDHLIMHVEDVSERNALQRQLLHRALSDDLTEIPNRPMLLDRLEQAVARRNRDGSVLAVLFVDVDDFKDVNDRYGHAAGDTVLRTVARRLRGDVRPGDTVARFGGDEFVVLCERTSAAEADGIARRLVAATSEPIALEVDGVSIPASASIGVAVAEGESPIEAEDLLRDSDAAMYEAKRGGRGRHAAFDAAIANTGARRRKRETEDEAELRRAIHGDGLHLEYQPQVSVADGTIVAHEALVRWRHPERGPLMPVDFVPLAERGGLIDDLGGWVLEHAARHAVEVGAPGVMWVNVSARQVDGRLPQAVGRALERSGLPPGRLGLELTESVLLRDLPNAGVVLGELRRLGVRLAVDDFGTGYSSLSYLAALPIDAIKVDRSFTARLRAAGPDHGIVAAIVAMAEALDLDVVVEGVERAEQLRILRGLGVQTAQGHHFGRPAATARAA